MSFFVTLTTVAVMLLYAVPGFLLVKTNMIKGDHIPSFSKVLMYVCQPCLTIYSFRQVPLSLESVKNMGLCFTITLFLQLGLVLTYFFLFRKKRKDVIWRIINLAAVFSNCGFLGIPILEALLPDHPEVLVYSSLFSIPMNLIGWSLGMYIISLDKSYVRAKKIFLTPAMFGFLAALLLFSFDVQLPAQLETMLTFLGRMSTPLCMLIMGMRLATVKIKHIFCDARQYLAVVLNQFVFPLVTFAVLYFLPISPVTKQALVILSACPVASMVQNYAELLGQGNDKAANMVLLGTMSSVITVPLMCLML